jgi:hypothetical protein
MCCRGGDQGERRSVTNRATRPHFVVLGTPLGKSKCAKLPSPPLLFLHASRRQLTSDHCFGWAADFGVGAGACA